MSAKNSAFSTAWKIIVGVLVALLILILVVEMGLRWFLSSQMSKQFEAEGAGKPEISFGSTPLVFGLPRGEFSELNMTTPSTLQVTEDSITGQPATEIHIKGLKAGEEPIARELVTTSTLPDDFLLVTLQQGITEQSGFKSLGNMVITNITANQAEDILDVEFGGGLFSLSLDPQVVDGNLAFAATSSKLLAWELPADATASISNALTEGMKNQLPAGNMRFEDVQVLDGEIALTMRGENVNLNEMESQYSTPALNS